MHHVRIPTVPKAQISGDHLEKIKRALSAAVGKPYPDLERESRSQGKGPDHSRSVRITDGRIDLSMDVIRELEHLNHHGTMHQGV